MDGCSDQGIVDTLVDISHIRMKFLEGVEKGIIFLRFEALVEDVLCQYLLQEGGEGRKCKFSYGTLFETDAVKKVDDCD